VTQVAGNNVFAINGLGRCRYPDVPSWPQPPGTARSTQGRPISPTGKSEEPQFEFRAYSKGLMSSLIPYMSFSPFLRVPPPTTIASHVVVAPDRRF
jgi:hypothetical protein